MPRKAPTSSANSRAALSTSSRNDRLCGICDDINFDRYLGAKIKENINLGTWSGISRSLNCPFCRLVTRCLQSNPCLTPRQPGTQVVLSNELSWKLGIELSPYDRSKSESYSNKFDLRSKAKQCLKDAYRFIVFAENEDGLSDDNQKARGHIQYLAYMETDDEDRQFFGRRVRAEIVDTDLLRSWLERCSLWHSDECKRDRWAGKRLPSSLRLIDVKQKCIVKAPKDKSPEYVALSYVWGTDEMKRETGMEPVLLQRENIERTAAGEMTSLPKKLPKTIEDAIRLTRLLGYQFLWLDALCIVQDDPYEEKILHLTNMKAIYSCASLTIAAAAGSHADLGLPGISVPRQNLQYSERVKGLRLGTMFPSFSELENSSSLYWNTRGWTFQEKLLSQRILLFTDYQVYFKCSESIWTEEVMMETERLSKSVEARRGKYRWQPNRERRAADGRGEGLKAFNPQLRTEDDWDYLGGFLDYTAAVQEYTKRKLTDRKDMLFAIKGVLETMEDVTGRFISGLPENHFLESLLWYPDLGTIHSYDPTNKLPSWTWVSSNFAGKGVSFDLMDVRELRALILASMRLFSTKKENSGSDSEKKHSSTDEPNPLALMGTYGNLLACLTWPLLQKGHTIGQMFFSDGSNFRQVKFSLPFSTFNLGDYDKSHIIEGLIGMTEKYAKSGRENWKPSVALVPNDKEVLVFETVVVKFWIGRSLHRRMTDNDDEAGIFELLNSDGECVGEIRVTHGRVRRQRSAEDFLTISWGLSLQHAGVHSAYIPRWGFNSRAKSNSRFWKIWNDMSDKASGSLMFTDVGFMPLAESLVQKYGRYLPKSLKMDMEAREEKNTASRFLLEVYSAEKGEARPRSLWPIVNLILVDWDGNIARRAGVGKVIMKAWQEAWSLPREVIFA
jgi:hypothetical protein